MLRALVIVAGLVFAMRQVVICVVMSKILSSGLDDKMARPVFEH